MEGTEQFSEDIILLKYAVIDTVLEHTAKKNHMLCLWTKVILWRDFSMLSSIEDKLKQMPKKIFFFTPPTLCNYDITETSLYLKSFCYISKNWILYNRFFFMVLHSFSFPLLISFLPLTLLFCLFLLCIFFLASLLLLCEYHDLFKLKPQHLELTDHRISSVSTYYK